MKVSRACSPTPSWSWATKAISGASAHRNQVTRLGWRAAAQRVGDVAGRVPTRLKQRPDEDELDGDHRQPPHPRPGDHGPNRRPVSEPGRSGDGPAVPRRPVQRPRARPRRRGRASGPGSGRRARRRSTRARRSRWRRPHRWPRGPPRPGGPASSSATMAGSVSGSRSIHEWAPPLTVMSWPFDRLAAERAVASGTIRSRSPCSTKVGTSSRASSSRMPRLPRVRRIEAAGPTSRHGWVAWLTSIGCEQLAEPGGLARIADDRQGRTASRAAGRRPSAPAAAAAAGTG